jgi:pilus assembly protein Flp/PilA
MTRFKNFVLSFIAEESGQDLIEYALLAGLLGLGAVLTLRGLATKVGTAFTSIGTTLSTNV